MDHSQVALFALFFALVRLLLYHPLHNEDQIALVLILQILLPIHVQGRMLLRLALHRRRMLRDSFVEWVTHPHLIIDMPMIRVRTGRRIPYSSYKN